MVVPEGTELDFRKYSEDMRAVLPFSNIVLNIHRAQTFNTALNACEYSKITSNDLNFRI